MKFRKYRFLFLMCNQQLLYLLFRIIYCTNTSFLPSEISEEVVIYAVITTVVYIVVFKCIQPTLIQPLQHDKARQTRSDIEAMLGANRDSDAKMRAIGFLFQVIEARSIGYPIKVAMQNRELLTTYIRQLTLRYCSSPVAPCRTTRTDNDIKNL